MPMMPTQPSMIESWSYADLRCNIHEIERKRMNDQEMDRPTFSTWEGGNRRHWRKTGKGGHQMVSMSRLLIGSVAMMAGGLWLLTILGFMVPWFSVLPMGLMMAGSFIIAAALNHGAVNEMTSHDRCDH